MKPIFVAFVSQKIKQDFEELNKGKFEDRKLYEFILRVFDKIK